MKLLFISLLISFLHWAHLSAEEILVTCQINKHITHYGGLKGVNEPELVLEGNSIDSLYQKKEFIKIDFDKKKLIDSSFNFRTKFSEIYFFDEPFANISGDFAVIHNVLGSWNQILLLFTMFWGPGSRFCCYLQCF